MKKNIMPVINGVAKVPYVMQLEKTECGAACMAMVMAYYGLWIPLEKMRVACGVSRDGSSGKNLLLAARGFGMDAHAYTLSPAEIKENGSFPCIINVGFAHYVVLCGFRGDIAIVNDPASGPLRVSAQDFDRLFTGATLIMSPTEAFVPGGKRPSMIAFTKKRLSGNRPALVIALLATVITSLAAFLNPAFSRILVDRLLTGANPEWLRPLITIMAIVAFIQLATLYIKAVYLSRIEGKFAIVADSTFLWHVLRLPMNFFAQRMAGDLLERQNTNATIASTMMQLIAPLFIDAIMMVVYLVIIIRINLWLTLIGLFSVAVNLFTAQMIARKRMNLMRVQTKNAGRRSGSTSAAIQMINVIKASGAERGYFENWAGYQAAENKAAVAMKKIDVYLGGLPELVSALTNILIIGVGVWFIMSGSFSVGMLLAFQGFILQFNAPVTSIINFSSSFQAMRVNMERVEDVMNYEVERQERVEPAESDYQKLTGNVEISNVTFGYSPLGKPLLKDFNMTLEPGRRVALVGASGCGKSTIAKLLAGLYRPWAGEIRFDGKLIDDINRELFSSSVAMVDQDITLFEDTIANNIKMWDESIEDFEMILAARDAGLHNDIMRREGGYNCVLREDGADLSGGQRQRLEIARVLAQDPTIIILDEATSALDAKTEFEVVESIRGRGIACVVVAHRLSTIRDCDEIIVLDNGNVVERGTHEELYAAGGLYTQLVSNE